MTRLNLPALDPSAVAEVRGSGYPQPFKSRMGDRAKRRLGDACGLTKLGVNLVTLGPGGQTRCASFHQPIDAAGELPRGGPAARWRHCVLSRRRPDVDRNGAGDGSSAQGWEALLKFSLSSPS